MLPKKLLGDTGLELSRIGLGTVKFGRNTQVKYPQQFKIPSLDQFLAMLSLAQELGINTLDTAPSYGDAENKLGKIFADTTNNIAREDWVLITKAGEEFYNNQSYYNFNANYINSSIDNSLQILNSDYIDILLIHSDGSDQQLSENDELWEMLEYRKQQGDIKAFGVSSKTVDGGLACLKRSDLAMVTYRSDYIDEQPILDYAKDHNKGILLKKAFNSGHNTHSEALKFSCSHKAVTSIIIGTINPEHLIDNTLACSSQI